MSRIDEAFKRIKREDFLPLWQRPKADWDVALPIGYGQTNSQPYTVRLMLNWLDPRLGQKILDVGSGSGWTTALLSNLVGPKGKVYAVEKVPQLVEFGRRNCKQLNLKNVEFHEGGNVYGLLKHAPYDRILVSASADHLPNELLKQLKVHGKLVIPIHETIYEITKTSKDEYEQIQHSGFVFVPLI